MLLTRAGDQKQFSRFNDLIIQATLKDQSLFPEAILVGDNAGTVAIAKPFVDIIHFLRLRELY